MVFLGYEAPDLRKIASLCSVFEVNTPYFSEAV
jgi:hypothetical protein